MTKAIFAVPAVLVMGCATMGRDPGATQVKNLEPVEPTNNHRDFDPSLASVLKPGVATVEDAKRLLGEPAYTSTQEGNKLLCVWNSSASDGQMNINSKSVTLVFGPDGRLLGPP